MEQLIAHWDKVWTRGAPTFANCAKGRPQRGTKSVILQRNSPNVWQTNTRGAKRPIQLKPCETNWAFQEKSGNFKSPFKITTYWGVQEKPLMVFNKEKSKCVKPGHPRLKGGYQSPKLNESGAPLTALARPENPPWKPRQDFTQMKCVRTDN